MSQMHGTCTYKNCPVFRCEYSIANTVHMDEQHVKCRVKEHQKARRGWGGGREREREKKKEETISAL